jgi:hypothetical protein
MTLTTPIAEQQARANSGMFAVQPSKIEQFVAKAKWMTQLIDLIWESDLVPLSYRGSRTERYPESKVKANLLAAGLLGDSMGVDPFMAWSNIYPTQAGRLGLAADFKVALCQRDGHQIETVVREKETCTVRGRRKGSETWVELTIDLDEAKLAGWTRNPLYNTRPGDMLYHRTSGRVADMIGADVVHGIATIDDLEDIPVEVEQAARPAIARSADVPGALPGDRIRSGIVGKLIEEQQPSPHDSAMAELVERARQEREALTVREASAIVRDGADRAQERRRAVTEDELAVEADEAEAVADAEDLVVKARRVMEEAGFVFEQLSSIADHTADDGEAALAAAPKITTATWAKINDLFRAVGITGKDQATADARLRVIRFVIGREIERGGEMATWEGEQVMEYLDGADPLVVQAIAYPTPQEETEE